MKETFQGRVLWFDAKKGYGFLQWEKEKTRQKDLFFHFSDLVVNGFKKIEKNRVVCFELGENLHGKIKAVKICIINA